MISRGRNMPAVGTTTHTMRHKMPNNPHLVNASESTWKTRYDAVERWTWEWTGPEGLDRSKQTTQL